MTENPYQAPFTDVERPLHQETSSQTAPPVVVEHLRHTRVWVKFCSLTGYITALFILIIDVLTIRKILEILPLYQTCLLGGFYAILAGLFVIPSLRLSKYERSITRLIISNQVEDLEQAIAHQRHFWKQIGIMILILLILYMITIVISALVLLAGKLPT